MRVVIGKGSERRRTHDPSSCCNNSWLLRDAETVISMSKDDSGRGGPMLNPQSFEPTTQKSILFALVVHAGAALLIYGGLRFNGQI